MLQTNRQTNKQTNRKTKWPQISARPRRAQKPTKGVPNFSSIGSLVEICPAPPNMGSKKKQCSWL